MGPGKCGGEADGGFHAVGAGNASTGDLEGGAVVGARSHKWEAERDIHAFVKGMELQRDQPLVVIHAKDTIELPLNGAVENGVGREGPLKVPMVPQIRNGRSDDFDFLAAEIAIFAGVGIQPRHGDSGAVDPLRDKKVGEEFSNTHDFRGVKESWNTRERNMGRHQSNSERTAGKAHGEIFDPGATGEKFGLAGKIKPHLMHGALTNRAGNNSLPIAGGELLGGRLQCGKGLPRRFWTGMTKPVLLRASEHFELATIRHF